jgi:hypothetical protein
MSWLFALACLFAAPVEASASDRIAVIGAEDGVLARQLEAELQLLGFDVVQVADPASTSIADLQGLARELGVAAAIRVDAHGGELELMVVDRVTAKTLLRTVAVGDVGDGEAARVAAVRAIDLLRASFRELDDRPPPPEAEVKPTPIVRRIARPSAPRFGIAFGPMVAGAMGGLGPTAHLTLAFEAMPHPRVGIAVRGVAPIVGARATAPEGSARVHLGWAVVGPRVRLRPADRTVLPSLGLAAGPLFVGMRGEPREGYVGRRDLVVAALIELDAALAIAVHPRLRLWLDASIDVAVPRAGVRFAGRRIASWGWLGGTGSVGVQVPF